MSSTEYPEYYDEVCANCWGNETGEHTYIKVNSVIGCRACASSISLTSDYKIPTQKRIQKVVRVDGSEYIMNKGALSVYTQSVPTYNNVNWNQQSDRAVPGVVHRNVPSHGCSTRSSITRMRPGSMSAGSSTNQGSKGVDMKHGSYDRYLARLKGGKPLRTQSEASTINNVPLYGDKTRMFGVAYSSVCQYPCVN
jgi:hypothetical protein